jgi:hypothetical protein
MSSVDFKFEIGNEVAIKALTFMVLAHRDRGNGLHDYHIVYWRDGKRYEAWLYESELVEPLEQRPAEKKESTPTDSEPWRKPPEAEQLPSEQFREELRSLINRHGLENGSNTPDFVLADYLFACLVTWNRSTNQRERFYFPKVEEIKNNEQ